MTRFVLECHKVVLAQQEEEKKSFFYETKKNTSPETVSPTWKYTSGSTRMQIESMNWINLVTSSLPSKQLQASSSTCVPYTRICQNGFQFVRKNKLHMSLYVCHVRGYVLLVPNLLSSDPRWANLHTIASKIWHIQTFTHSLSSIFS